MKKMVFTVSLILMGLTAAGLSVPVEWSLSAGGNGHFYEAVISPTAITWLDAFVEAENRGGYLATITSPQENLFVFSLISDNAFWFYDSSGYYSGPLIGGFQPEGSEEPAGGWGWITGEDFVYAAWGTEQPNNHGGNQNVIQYWNIAFTTSPTWQDVNINAIEYSYVIEYIPEPAAITLLTLGGMSFIIRRKQTKR